MVWSEEEEEEEGKERESITTAEDSVWDEEGEDDDNVYHKISGFNVNNQYKEEEESNKDSDSIYNDGDEYSSEYNDDDDDEEDDDNEEEEEEEEEDDDSYFSSRPSSTMPMEEDEATANAIINSLQNIFPELGTSKEAIAPILSEANGGNSAVENSSNSRKETALRPEKAFLTTLPPGKPSVRMTDLGYKISQLVLHKKPADDETERMGPTAVNRGNFFGKKRGEEDEEEDHEGEPVDAFVEKTLSGRRRNRTGIRGRPKKVDYGFGKSTTHKLVPEVARIMGQANISYVSRRYDEAIRLLLEVVRLAPHAFEAYQTLAMIHEEMGDKAIAMSYYVIAAHLIKTDGELWRKLAKLTLELGKKGEAIYFLGKLTRQKDAPAEYFWIRAKLLVEREEYKRAILGFSRLLLAEIDQKNLSTTSFSAVNILAERVCHSSSAIELFYQVLEEAVTLRRRLPSMEVLLFVLDLLLKRKEFDKVLKVIDLIAIPFVGAVALNLSTDWFTLSEGERLAAAKESPSLPWEVKLYEAVAKVYLKLSINLDVIIDSVNIFQYGRYLKLLGEALLSCARPEETLAVILPLMQVPEIGDTDLGVLIGECYKLIPGQEDMAISTFEAVLEDSVDNTKVRSLLVDLYNQTGQFDLAKKLTEGRILKGNIEGLDIEDKAERPASVQAAFAGLFDWDVSGAALANEDIANLFSFPMAAVKKSRSKINRRRRRVKQYTSYSAVQMSAVLADYHQINRIWANKAGNVTALRQIKHIAGRLVEDDMLNNAALRPTEGMRQIVRTGDGSVQLELFHGLNVDQWFDVLCKYLIVECQLGHATRALFLLKFFLAKSIFPLDPQFSITLRLFSLGFANEIGTPNTLLSASRWFIRRWPRHTFALSVVHKVIEKCHPDELAGPFLRFIERMAVHYPGQPTFHMLSLNIHLSTERYEGAILAGIALLNICPNHKSALLSTAIALLHQSVKRTCKTPYILQKQAMALLARYSHLAPMGEAEYNMGRAMHMMGLIDLAIGFYKKALMSGLMKREAAFNLHLIALANNQVDLATYYIGLITPD